MTNMSKFLVAVFLMICAESVYAHPGHTHDMVGFAAGFYHPLGGIDHMLSMLAIGLLAGYKGGRSLFLVPLLCIAALTAGTMLAGAGSVLPYTEIGILFTLVVSGSLLAFRVKLALPFLFPLIALFSLCHGYVHGIEMPLNAQGLEYGIGLVSGSSLLLLVGMLLSSIKGREQIVAYLGAAIAFVGVGLLVA
jgi:urease accessory protein